MSREGLGGSDSASDSTPYNRRCGMPLSADYDVRRENAERYAQEDRDDDTERIEAERNRWRYQGGTTADEFE